MELICQKICDVKEQSLKGKTDKIENPLTQEEKEMKTDDEVGKLNNVLSGVITISRCGGCPAKGCVKCCIFLN